MKGGLIIPTKLTRGTKVIRKIIDYLFPIYQKEIGLVIGILCILLFIYTINQEDPNQIDSIQRPGFMEGKEEKTLYFYNDDIKEEQSIRLYIKEGEHSKKDIEVYLDSVSEKFEHYIQSQFDQYESIVGPLALPESFMSCRIEYTYFSDSKIDEEGWFIYDNWKASETVKLEYRLMYEDITRENQISIIIKKGAFTSAYKSMYANHFIDSSWNTLNNDLSVKDINLPQAYTFYDRPSSFSWSTGLMLLIIILITSILLIRFELKLREIQLKKMKRIHLTYIINNFVLFYNTGMTIKKSLEYSLQNRIKSLESKNDVAKQLMTYLIQLEQDEDILIIATSFNDFFANTESRRFTRLLIQNLKQGDHLLSHQLLQLAENMWDDRIRRARKESEKASSKLIFPMLLIFVVILMITIIPTLIEVKRFM